MTKPVGLFLLILPFWLAGQTPRPNILFIMSDDHAVRAVSSYDSSLHRTPNIDRIAQNGMRFDRAFCTNSICSPVRAVNLTGKMSHVNKILDNTFAFDGSQPTAPKYLRDAGYQTAMIGKWHLKSDPTGFDYWKILVGQGEYYNPEFIDNGKRVQAEGYATTLITDDALAWLQNRDPAKPFFMMLHHKAPHRNWMPDLPHLNLYDDIQIPEPPTLFDAYATRSAAAREQEMRIADDMDLRYDLKVWQDTSAALEPWMAGWMQRQFESMTPRQRAAFQEAYRAENEAFLAKRPTGEELARWKYQRYIKDYLRCLASLDENVGRVLDYLKKTGLDTNTIVIYTSDQGFYLGEHGWYDKRFMYEESYRQPLLAQWPGHIPAGSSTGAMVMNLDFAPTFLDLAGVAVPRDMQGVSLKPILLSGETPQNWRRETYYHYFEYPGVHAVKRHYGLRTERYKLLHYYYDIDAWELYDLEQDPREMRNVYGEKAYASVQRELHAKLDSLQRVYRDFPAIFQDALIPDTAKHLAVGASYRLVNPPERPHNGRALTDGFFREYSIYNAALQDGYAAARTQPLEVVLDLGKKKTFKKISVHCRQLTESWVYYPAFVELQVSDDGKEFGPSSVLAMAPPSDFDADNRWIHLGITETKARYIRVKVAPLGSIPPGRPGAGEPAWIFCDEISVE